MKIVIVGAGIAGLTLAHACQQAQIEVVVVEKAKQLQTIGGGLIIWPHGMHYFKEMGLGGLLEELLIPAARMHIHGHRGNTIYSEVHDHLYQLLEGKIYPVDRNALQQKLVSQLNPGVLQLNKAVQEIKQGEQSAEVFFADGSKLAADLVVGADGVRSVVRQAMSPEIKPVYTGYSWWGGIVDGAVVPHFHENDVQFILGANKHCFVWPLSGKRLMWYLTVKMPQATLNFQQAAATAEGWHEDVRRLIMAPQCAQHFQVPIYEVPPLRQMVSGRLIVIGDAACTIGPFLGQGANKAIEDAYVLSRLLQKTDPLMEIQRHYSALRYARHARLFQLEQQSADALTYGTVAELLQFEEQLPLINLATMYQDMIPLVNAAAISGISALH